MKLPARWVLASASFVLLAVVLVLAVALGPPEARILLLAFSVLAGAAAIQSLTSEPRDLSPALVLALPPVMALATPGSPTWLIGPLAVLLFLAGELNALGWESRGPFPLSAAQRRRLLDSLALAMLALGGGLAVEAVVARGVAGGRAAVAVAALVLGTLGLVLFREGAEPSSAEPSGADQESSGPGPGPVRV